jgi:2-(1,2-epoxy-1,2-dihydrophenyl)acetyl-CoA isomerase
VALLDVEHRPGGVALVRIAGAKEMNSFDPEALDGMNQVITGLLADDAVRALVLTGTGDAFCAGADVRRFQAALDAGTAPELLREATTRLHALLVTLRTCDRPVIAAVNGVAAGGGLGLALAADARIGSPAARFAASYFRLGVSPDGGATWLLPRLIGEPRARRFLMDNEVMDAETALGCGLLDHLVPAGSLVNEAVALAARWGAWSRNSIGGAKQLLDGAGHRSLADQLRAEQVAMVAAAATPDFAEGVAAFLGRRTPAFQQ